MNQSYVYSLQTPNLIWIGRVFRISPRAMLRYFSSKEGLCSEKFLSDCGRPASRSATFSPASARRLHAQPPEAPEPTTITSKARWGLSDIRCQRKRDASKQSGAGQFTRMTDL